MWWTALATTRCWWIPPLVISFKMVTRARPMNSGDLYTFVDLLVDLYSEEGLRVKMWEWTVSQESPDVPVSKSSGWLVSAKPKILALWLEKGTLAGHTCSGRTRFCSTHKSCIIFVAARDALMQSVCSTNEALAATRWTTDQQIVLGTSVEKERMLENLSLSTSMWHSVLNSILPFNHVQQFRYKIEIKSNKSNLNL